MKTLSSSVALLASSALIAAVAPAAAQQTYPANAITRPDVTDLGAAPPTTQVELAITLNYQNKAALDDLVLQQATASSPLYHQFLTPDQFAVRFGPTPDQHAQVVAALQRAGLTLVRTYPNRTV